VYRADVPVGHVRFRVKVERASVAKQLEPVAHEAARYRYAFISYASQDRPDMLKVLQGFDVNGIRYFADIHSLEPGDRWERRIEAGLEECDLFLLIWSKQAKASDWVKKEVLHALKRQGERGHAPPRIHPIFVEWPIELPWREASKLHFNSPLLHGAPAVESRAPSSGPDS
jgi:hypothetical protein